MYDLLPPYDVVFKDFAGRDAALEKVKRFKIYKPMFYRTNLVGHSRHVLWLLQSMLPAIYAVYGKEFDATKAQLMAAVHDDAETIMGDVEAGIKRKMTPEQLANLDKIELDAIEELADRSPKKILGYSYADLMREAVGVETLEARLGKFADRFDAHGESLHEIFAGNRRFITPIVNEWGTIDLPAPFYVRFLNEFKEHTPDLAALYEQRHTMLTPPVAPDYESIVSRAKPHTKESLTHNTGYAHYDFWKSVLLTSGDEKQIQHLFTRTEF